MFSGVILAIKLNYDVVGFSEIFFITSLITLIFALLVYTWKFGYPKIEIDFGFWKSTMREAIPYGLSGIFVMIYYWIDSIMLSAMVGNEVVGYYNAAYRIIAIFLSFHTLFILSIFPVMASTINLRVMS